MTGLIGMFPITIKNIKVKYKDLDGDTITKDFSGLESICIQHEIDHLKGKLIIDYISS